MRMLVSAFPFLRIPLSVVKNQILHKPFEPGVNCRAVGLSQRNDNDSRMNGMNQRHSMVEVAIRCKNRCFKALSFGKDNFIVGSKLADIVKQNSLVSAFFYQINCGTREILIQKKSHSATPALSYGMSSKRASEPAKANTAGKSSAERLG